jgi:hypothetical protein
MAAIMLEATTDPGALGANQLFPDQSLEFLPRLCGNGRRKAILILGTAMDKKVKWFSQGCGRGPGTPTMC